MTAASDYDYELPPDLIAKYPPPRREDARMMVLDRGTGTIAHREFADFPGFVGDGALVVLNDTRVVPARVFADDGKVELLVLERPTPTRWRCYVKPGRRMRPGAAIRVDGIGGTVVAVAAGGEREVEFAAAPDLGRVGRVPLPPYLRRAAEPLDTERYQTVYAARPGAVAAPTAGLHFTPAILARLRHAFVTLHVGPGTFRPVQEADVSRHRMDAEAYVIGAAAAGAINAARAVIAVGTTVARTLETVAATAPAGAPGTRVVAGGGFTDLFIRPPFAFRATDALLTNFHLPRSTLLMLVAAFAGRELVFEAYRAAVGERYRFYSYGDCMLIR